MTLLLLAGTAEAHKIATELQNREVPAIASLSGATRSPQKLPIRTRIGGFGGAAGFRDFLKAQNIHAVFDATHPFAHEISQRSAEICQQQNIPYCQLLRPPWQAEAGDRWFEVAEEAEVAKLVPQPQTLFLATGRQTLHRFANLAHCRLICRQIDPPEGPFPFPNGEFLIGRPPFSVADEISLFRKRAIDWLVVKNAGGEASRSKLIATRELGVKVVMIARPPQPVAPKVETVGEALQWIAAL